MNNNIKLYNIYSVLYISSDDETAKKDIKPIARKKKQYLCDGKCIKDFSRKSYKKYKNYSDNIENNNKYKNIENNINFLILNHKTNDNSLIPMKKYENHNLIGQNLISST